MGGHACAAVGVGRAAPCGSSSRKAKGADVLDVLCTQFLRLCHQKPSGSINFEQRSIVLEQKFKTGRFGKNHTAWEGKREPVWIKLEKPSERRASAVRAGGQLHVLSGADAGSPDTCSEAQRWVLQAEEACLACLRSQERLPDPLPVWRHTLVRTRTPVHGGLGAEGTHRHAPTRAW